MSRQNLLRAAAAALTLSSSFLSAQQPVPLPGSDTASLTIGGAASWDALVGRESIEEVVGARRWPALAISSARSAAGADLSLSFDEADPAAFSDSAGRYSLSASPAVAATGASRARAGSGAALFAGAGDSAASLVLRPGRDALFAAGNRLGDFSVEFWLYPAIMENGEQILSWTANSRTPAGIAFIQRFRLQVARNRLEWTFADFFESSDRTRRRDLALASRSAPVPRTWSHHLLRFDAGTGLLEYLVDGRLESAVHSTPSGAEGGEVFRPSAGSGGVLEIAPRYAGLVDEFRIHPLVLESPRLSRYPRAGGRATTRFLDLGAAGSRVARIDLRGDAGKDGAEIRLFARAGESPYGWKDDEATWTPVRAGIPLGAAVVGRWVQIAAVLYPDGKGEATPLLEELTVFYERDEPPRAPGFVAAEAGDSSVALRWRASPDADAAGYLVYYGESSGEYFGTGAAAGPSPVDVGKRTSFVVDGLRNGTLYYFSIAAYDRGEERRAGAQSREVAARPARTVR